MGDVRTALGSLMSCSMEYSMNSPQSVELVCCGTGSLMNGHPLTENISCTPPHACAPRAALVTSVCD
jgi:hypothetical protein